MAKPKEKMDVERLVTWALLEQGLGWSMYGDRPGVLSYRDYGTRIDTGGIGAPSAALASDDDAHVVRAVILTLPEDAGQLVVRHGRIGDRPDWCEEGVGEWRQKRAANGKLAWHYEKPGDRRSPKVPVKEFVGWRQEQVEFFRAGYRLWWTALSEMIPVLNRQMSTHEATGPKVAKEPWLQSVPVIHTPDGPLFTSKTGRSRVSREYVEIDGQLVRRT